ncbi:MAG TPA: tripartite tricarboxylate transporter permease [Alphaproteobacteria bacterium]|nr:tripartite tricarboxylate transporter permease [Alphaproteobacteria bacterium]
MLMTFGVVIASFFAAAPGIGGILLLSLLMPYAVTLKPYEFIALIIGAATVGNTATTFTSVLVGVPGGVGSQATILDGYPMAKRGEANRAFGAAFLGSAVGAIFGALVFVASLPILGPLVLSLGSPDFFVLVLWGLSAVAVLGGKEPVKGLAAAAFGLAIALIGTDARTGIERFTFDGTYLWNGLSIVIVSMGVFAIPELFELAVKRTRITDTLELGSGLWEGCKDVFRHWWLVIRSSAVGVWVGILPGLGSAVADWFAYAHAVQTEKNPETFGKGDVRGVLASETSNNAKEGGDLIPTLLFGIPGSSSMAIILIGLIAVGVQPGASMLTTQRPLMFSMLWTLVIANLMATALAMAFAKPFSKACLVPYYDLIPAVLLFCIIGVFSVTYDLDDLLAFLIFSVVGVFMKRNGWPRAPLMVAVVLGPQVQQYLWLSTDRYGLEWLVHWDVLLLGGFLLATVLWPMYRNRRDKRETMDMDIMSEVRRPTETGSIVMCGLLIAMFAYMVIAATQWPLRASISVYFIACIGILVSAIQIGRDMVTKRQIAAGVVEAPVPYAPVEIRREFEFAAWIIGMVIVIALVGFHIAFFLFPLAYTQVYGPGWKRGLTTAICGEALLWFIFDYMNGVVWPEPLLLPFLYN